MSDYAKLVEDLKRGFGHWYVEDWSRLVSMYADAAAAIEALQAEIRESMQKCAECGDRMVEPKQGEWIWIQKANGGQYKGCSVCHAPIPTDSMLDYLDDEDCDFCYSCGAKMEVQE